MVLALSQLEIRGEIRTTIEFLSSILENKEYKIYGENIFIKLKEEISNSNEPVKVINSMGVLKSEGFKNLDNEGIIIFKGEVEFLID